MNLPLETYSLWDRKPFKLPSLSIHLKTQKIKLTCPHCHQKNETARFVMRGMGKRCINCKAKFFEDGYCYKRK